MQARLPLPPQASARVRGRDVSFFSAADCSQHQDRRASLSSSSGVSCLSPASSRYRPPKVLFELVAGLRSVCQCSAHIGSKPFVSSNLPRVLDDVTRGAPCPLYLRLPRAGQHDCPLPFSLLSAYVNAAGQQQDQQHDDEYPSPHRHDDLPWSLTFAELGVPAQRQF